MPKVINFCFAGRTQIGEVCTRAFVECSNLHAIALSSGKNLCHYFQRPLQMLPPPIV